MSVVSIGSHANTELPRYIYIYTLSLHHSNYTGGNLDSVTQLPTRCRQASRVEEKRLLIEAGWSRLGET